ncbi:MAG: heme-binding protein, partial [Alphaproteobacteria bacterium]|nr:heme-binding protein [Alphaproteobacteria bacterium]
MADTVPHLKLTYEGANKILAGAVAKANAMGAPQCIVVADDGGHMLAFARSDGATGLAYGSAT